MISGQTANVCSGTSRQLSPSSRSYCNLFYLYLLQSLLLRLQCYLSLLSRFALKHLSMFRTLSHLQTNVTSESNHKPGNFYKQTNCLFQCSVMGLVVQEPVMYEGSLWLSTCRGICLTLVQIKKSKKKKEETTSACQIRRECRVLQRVTSGHQRLWQ